jgi:hypothetical protein
MAAKKAKKMAFEDSDEDSSPPVKAPAPVIKPPPVFNPPPVV